MVFLEYAVSIFGVDASLHRLFYQFDVYQHYFANVQILLLSFEGLFTEFELFHVNKIFAYIRFKVFGSELCNLHLNFVVDEGQILHLSA